MTFHSKFFQHLRDKHGLPDICCPEIDCLSHEELVGLYKALEYEYIPYENKAAHSAVRKIMEYLRQHEQSTDSRKVMAPHDNK